MPSQSVAGIIIIGAFVIAGCGSDDERPPPSGTGGIVQTGGAGGAPSGGQPGEVDAGASGGGGASGSGAAGSSTGGAGGADAGGSGGAPPEPVCGNDQREGTEECDGPDFSGTRCVDFGFEQGNLVCDADCTIDPAGCSGVEGCADGHDNDGDGDADCEDADCGAACLDACSAVTPLTLPARIDSTTFGHASSSEAGCAAETGSADVVYSVVAPITGFLEAAIQPNAPLVVSVRTACGGGTELACDSERASASVTAGETYYIHVDGSRASTIGAFVLDLHVATATCGNGARDPGEECDDGLTVAGDGCSSMCTVESDEDSDNDTVATADLYTEVYDGHVTVGDVDYVAIVVTADNTSMLVETIDWGDGACDDGLQNTYLEVLAEDGTTVLGANDNGLNSCSQVRLGASSAFGQNLDARTYYVRVSAPPGLPDESFPYRLSILADRCGNGVRGVLEQCDDGNTTPGDSCDGRCLLE